MAKINSGKKTKSTLKLSESLALSRWVLSLFGVNTLEDLSLHLKDETLEGLDENNIHRLYHAIIAHFPSLPALSATVLLEYDQNIVRHTKTINERRCAHGEKPIQWKYFQYLSLLFTEIYLDRYFHDPVALKADVADMIKRMNEGREEGERIPGFVNSDDPREDLNKLAFWMATGSGKTLVMHVNILQFLHYLQKTGSARKLNRIILLTPNEGLSQQHLREFELSGIDAELFSKEGSSLFTGHAVEILEVTKLKDEMGDKTIAVDAFEDNNLVLIDEGHRGAGSGEDGAWMRYRNALCERGFSFEYSATFAQAIRGNAVLTGLYSRSILFDYSYRYFYNDGFGKDYQILNLDGGVRDEQQELYLVACLLSFFQQQKLFTERENEFRSFHLEKPLWIFVGSKVTATLATKDASDIVEILKFLSRFVAERSESVACIRRVLGEGLVTSNGKNLFAGRFPFLLASGLESEALYSEILALLFNASAGGLLYVENLKGAQGEIALKVGADNEPFGCINVGEDTKLVKLCTDQGMETGEREFSGSLFHEINTRESTVNVLIGSKKFTEGWSSWRVSTMGLMNIGATEGAQIIQLFGRGVRLKGYGQCLKRSGKALLPMGVKKPEYIRTLETLSIFGIHADYMAQFRDFLEEEGLPGNSEQTTFILPVLKSVRATSLKTIKLRDKINGVSTEFGDAFRRLAPVPTLALPGDYLKKNTVVLNWYPKIQAIKSKGMDDQDEEALPNSTHLQSRHILFLDIDSLWFTLERFKAERGWYNINIPRSAIPALLADPSWYELEIPETELMMADFRRVRLWTEIAEVLLKKYMERFYSYRKKEWELPYLEYADLTDDDPNLLLHDDGDENGYRIRINEGEEEIVGKLEALKALIVSGKMKDFDFPGGKALMFGQHLYQPLLCADSARVEISPVPLNHGERTFIEDLRSYHENNPDYFKKKELYVLRNLSKGKGVGFFEAGNFHPDFIIWILEGSVQYVTFADPKGLRQVDGVNDPKIQFYKTIKEIEARLGDKKVVLNSFIISDTLSHEVLRKWNTTKEHLASCNVLFQEEDKDRYVGEMFSRLKAE